MAGTTKTPSTTEPPRRNSRKKQAPVVVKKADAPKARPGRKSADLQPVRPAPPRRSSAPSSTDEEARGPRAGARRAHGDGGRMDSARAPRKRHAAVAELPESGAKIVGGPRNEHGTRVARRVTCARCQTSDHVPYVPKDPSKALCRTCAAEVLKTYEAGVRVRTPTRTIPCNLCGTPFELPLSAEDDGDPLCPSCLRGFTSWQGSVDVPFTERTQVVVEERLSGALVRKRRP